MSIAARPPRRRGRLVLGAAMLAVAGAGIGYPLFWHQRSASGGAILLAQSLAGSPGATACPSDPAKALAPRGAKAAVLEIPSLGLRAPVLEGLSDAVLDVAVGHFPASPWPGNAGESVLEAHDVSYFAGLGGIRAGAVVNWVTPCGTAKFVVTGTSVRSPGDFISTPPGGVGLALITCWPTDALFWTNQRWVVTTKLVKTTLASQSLPNVNPPGPKLTVPAPPSLIAQNLTLRANESLIHLHKLAITGSPVAAWKQGPGPMSVERSALAAYIGAYKAITRQNRSWWSALAPGLAMPSRWPRFSAVNVTITVVGATPQRVTLASSTATMTLSVSHGTMTITSLR